MNTNLRLAFRTLIGIGAVLTIVKVYNFEDGAPVERQLSKNNKNNNAYQRNNKARKLDLKEDDRQRIATFTTAAKSVVFIDTLQTKTIKIPDHEKGSPKNKSKQNQNQNRKTVLSKKAEMEKLNSITTPLGSGTGWVYDKQGHIVTNNHVVEGGTEVEVSILTKKDVSDENAKLFPTSLLGYDPSIDLSLNEHYHWRVVKAKVIGTDPENDIAVIKIDVPKTEIHPVDFGDDTTVEPGADCLAIGNPFGLDHTLTAGIISAKGRTSHSESGVPMTGLIQTDTAINPGNSGGPLLTEDGKVIGMNSMIMSKSGSSSGIGFAIPITRIITVVNHLIKYGKVVRADLGMSFAEGIQAYLGVQTGVLIGEVHEGGAASKAELKGTLMDQMDGSIELGDIIVQLDDTQVNNEIEIFTYVHDKKNPGDEIKVKIIRTYAKSITEKTVTLTLKSNQWKSIPAKIKKAQT